MQPEIHLGPITLQSFGIAFALGFIAAGAVLGRRLRELGKPADWAYEMIVFALVGGIVGARINYVIENYDAVKGDLLGNLFSGSGLVWFGGAIGGALAVGLWAWRRKMLNLTLLDISTVPLAVGYAVGRIGCQVSGDGDYGTAWDGPWAMAYPHGTKPIDTPVQPTPIYETLAMGLVAYFLWRLRDRVQPGVLFAIYLVLAGTERLLVEFIRRNSAEFLGLTQPQLISIPMIAIGLAWLAVKARRGELTKSPPPGAQTAAIRTTA
jgi:phosphatidylglycerol:prolipoprotein diacylglycerol transferase